MRTLACFTALLLTCVTCPAFGQVGYTTYSVEWLTGSSDSVFLAVIDELTIDGKPLSSTNAKPISDRQVNVRLKVLECLKGERLDTVDFQLRVGLADDLLLRWHRENLPVVWFLVTRETDQKDGSQLIPRGEFIAGESAIELGAELDDTVPRPILTASLTPLDTGRKIIAAIKVEAETHHSKPMTEFVRKYISYETALFAVWSVTGSTRSG